MEPMGKPFIDSTLANRLSLAVVETSAVLGEATTIPPVEPAIKILFLILSWIFCNLGLPYL